MLPYILAGLAIYTLARVYATWRLNALLLQFATNAVECMKIVSTYGKTREELEKAQMYDELTKYEGVCDELFRKLRPYGMFLLFPISFLLDGWQLDRVVIVDGDAYQMSVDIGAAELPEGYIRLTD